MDDDFDIDRYLLDLDRCERSHWNDELVQTDTKTEIDKLFQECDFEPVQVSFDPDVFITMENGQSDSQRPYYGSSYNYRNKLKREYQQEVEQMDAARRRKEEEAKHEEKLRKAREYAAERRRKLKEEAIKKREEEEKLRKQRVAEKMQRMIDSLHDSIIGIQFIGDKSIVLCDVQSTDDMSNIVILFDDTAFVITDVIRPSEKFKTYAPGIFEYLWVYDELEKHLKKYLTYDAIMELGKWIRELKHDGIIRGITPVFSNDRYYSYHDKHSVKKCNGPTISHSPCSGCIYKGRCTLPHEQCKGPTMPQLHCSGCIYEKHCALSHEQEAINGRVHAFHIDPDWF